MPLVNKTFSDIITFDRASSATLFDSSGTLVYAPMNLVTYSEEFDNAAWTKLNASITTNATTSPDGTTTADKLIEALDVNLVHQVGQTGVTVVSLGTYTASAFVKADTRTRVRIGFLIAAGGGVVADANLTAGTIGSPSAFGGGAAVGSSIQAIGNGWYRISVSGSGAAGTSGEIRLELLDASGNRQYNGDGTSGIFIWGVQLNIANMQGGVTGDLSTYYPTTSAAYQGPRLDYNPATLAARGLLIEEQRTNLLTYSEEFDNASGWASTRASVSANATTAPTGTSVADKIVEDTTASNTHLTVSADVSVSTATVYTYSVYAKAAGRTWFNMQIATGAGAYGATVPFCYFELSGAGSVGNGASATGSITAVGNGWYRCVLVAVATTSASTTNMRIKLATADGVETYTGDGTSGIFVFGAQLEAGAFATSYIPTTTTALTRSADVASVNTLSPWFNASEGTLFAQAEVSSVALADRAMALLGRSTSVTQDIVVSISRSADSRRILAIVNLTGQLSYAPAGTATSSKGAVAYKTDDSQGAFDGASSPVDTSVTLPTLLTTLYLGNSDGGTSHLNGWLKRVTYYPRRLSQAELEAITS